MTARTQQADTAAVETLRDAASTLHDAREELQTADVDDRGSLKNLVTAYRDVRDILERYEERATDWDDFEGYVEFREELSERLAELSADLPYRDAFAQADDELTTAPQKVLSTSDFERAREHLAPVRDLVERYEHWQTAREDYHDLRGDVIRRRNDLRERIDDLERIQRLGTADLDAPVERIRDPIEAYNERVREAFEQFRDERPIREVLAFVGETTAYPLIEFRRPPEKLREYVEAAPVGSEPLSTLLQYLDYSRSKLDHYVDDPQDFQAAVAPNRTFLQRLDADPLTVDWPPPAADELYWLGRELIAVVGRFADEEVTALARNMRDLPTREDYDRLRESAVARDELDESERDRLRRGEIERELETSRTRLERVEDALSAQPPLSELDDPI